MAFGLEKLTSVFTAGFGKRGDRKIVGVDIGASAIKVVQLRDEQGVPALDTYGEIQLGPYDHADIGQIVRLKTSRLTEALVDIIRESAITADEVALTISYASSFTTTITLDILDEEGIANRLPVEARKYVPVSLDEVTLDWFPLAQDTEAGTTTLLLVAIYNEALSRLQTSVAGASLNTSFTELEPFSTIRSAVAQQDNTVALIDWGAGATKLYIVQNGVLRATHSFKPTGAELTKSIKDACEISFSEAEELKRRQGLRAGEDANGQQAARTLNDALSRGVREIDRAMRRHEQSAGVTIDRVLITGGGASLQGLPELMQDTMQRQVITAQPFSKVAYQVFLEDTLKELGPSFAVAVGAALRSFN